jgi:hypothetical protein
MLTPLWLMKWDMEQFRLSIKQKARRKKMPRNPEDYAAFWCCLYYVKRCSGGEGGIRTHVRHSPKPDFESGAFDHSATSPDSVFATRKQQSARV